MMRALALEAGALSRGAGPDPLGAFDPRVRVLCALAFALALSLAGSFRALLWASPIPLALLFWGPMEGLSRVLPRLNIASLVMTLLLAWTYPGSPVALWGRLSVSREGLRMGLLIAARLNLVSIVLLRLAAPMGPVGLDAALARLGLPEKLRVLLLLTLRGVLLLLERMEAALLSLHLRAPRLRGTLKWRAFACVAASALVQGADRSERMMMALRCRGGMAGFSQVPALSWRRRDTALCLAFALNIAAMFLLPLARWR